MKSFCFFLINFFSSFQFHLILIDLNAPKLNYNQNRFFFSHNSFFNYFRLKHFPLIKTNWNLHAFDERKKIEKKYFAFDIVEFKKNSFSFSIFVLFFLCFISWWFKKANCMYLKLLYGLEFKHVKLYQLKY